jgi:hypothetical protein
VRDTVEEKKELLMKVENLENVSDSLKKYVITKNLSWCKGSMGFFALD